MRSRLASCLRKVNLSSFRHPVNSPHFPQPSRSRPQTERNCVRPRGQYFKTPQSAFEPAALHLPRCRNVFQPRGFFMGQRRASQNRPQYPKSPQQLVLRIILRRGSRLQNGDTAKLWSRRDSASGIANRLHKRGETPGLGYDPCAVQRTDCQTAAGDCRWPPRGDSSRCGSWSTHFLRRLLLWANRSWISSLAQRSGQSALEGAETQQHDSAHHQRLSWSVRCRQRCLHDARNRRINLAGRTQPAVSIRTADQVG